ncbi:phosphotransferase family protein [Streptomyces sp. GbtcB7]|uniref:phosphotransferase family protein n=1 Tax=Streptomyces sp. GbtcB7 TaxID=2824752 RepID=UPI001C2F3257|nr:phosphotransferase family protein [Streptomyces sp. GbtcB7]
MSSAALAADDIVQSAAEVGVGAREPLVILDGLTAYLDEHDLGRGPVQVEPIGEGHSNVTMAVRREGADLVLRRPPRGPLPPSAHDMVREARVIRALGPTGARVPHVVAICDDAAVIGAPFFLSERVEGHVITGTVAEVFSADEDRRRIADELVDALVEVHAVDWSAAGLDGLGRPSGYLERQLRRFSGLWEHSRTREFPLITEVAAWLAANRPADGDTTVVHGDYRLGNVMLAPDAPARLVAVFDWEMAPIGDPLADLGYLSMLWVDAQDPPLGQFEIYNVTRQAGFPSRADLINAYAERSGRDVSGIRWYQVLALWKAAIFMEGNYRRAVSGSSDDPFLKSFGEGVLELGERAQALINGA